MAQTLKFGKGTWATKTGSSMAYNDQNGNYKPLPFNVERDSIATRVNKQGLIEVVGKDKLRIDYTDSAKGVALLEPSRTNLLPYSEDFIVSNWTKTRCTVTSNQAVSPDGNLTADLMTATGDDARLEDQVGSSGQQYTQSIYVKSAQSTNVNGQMDFAGLNPVTFTANQQWQRINTTLTDTNQVGRVRVRITNNGDALYVWGGQIEAGTYPTSYIPTSGSTVQRQADVVNGSGNSEVFNDSEGVLFADVKSDVLNSDYKTISISDGSTSNRIRLQYHENNTQIRGASTINSVNNIIDHTPTDITSNFKLAVSYNATELKFFVNGFLIDTLTINNTWSGSVLNRLSFDGGSTSGGLELYGKTKEIGYYDAVLTDEELEYLTSYRSLNELVTELNLNTL